MAMAACAAVAVTLASGCGLLGRGRGRSPSVPLRTDGDPAWGEEELPGVSEESTAYRLRPGDVVVISLRTPAQDQVETALDERGEIRLPLLESPLRVSGLTGMELARAVERAYVENGIYRHVTASVTIPARSYFVQGEVRNPGRFPVVGGMTLRQAIAAAAGYTDFANPRRIQVTRAGQTFQVDARAIERSPERDIEVRTGDIIFVPRGIW